MSDDPNNTPYGRLAAALKTQGKRGWEKRCQYVWEAYEFWHAHSYSQYTWLYWEEYFNGLLHNARLVWGKDSEEYRQFVADIPDINAGVRQQEWEMKSGSYRF